MRALLSSAAVLMLATAACDTQDAPQRANLGAEPNASPAPSPAPSVDITATPASSELPVAGAPVGSADLTSAEVTATTGDRLKGRTIAVLATDGVEEVELQGPRTAFKNEGARTVLLSPHGGEIQTYNHVEKGDLVRVDDTIDGADPKAYDGLFLPGGVQNADALRLDPKAVAFAKAFAQAGKPIVAICHGPWLLVEAGVVRGKTMTSWPSLRTDLTNAGAKWVDEAVEDDRGLVTSRKPDDLPGFNARAIDELAKAPQRR